MVALAAALALGARSPANRRGPIAAADPVLWCTVVYLVIALARIAPGYLSPRYSMREASRNLGQMFSASAAIASIGADGLFNENQLRYESLTVPEFGLELKMPNILGWPFTTKRWARRSRAIIMW